MFILSEKIYLERFYWDLKDKVLEELSETGYVIDEFTFIYIQHFERQSRSTCKNVHRILFCDGYESHLTHEVLEFYEFWNIYFFTFPLHTTHFLQPFDVVLFQSYKYWHAQAVDQVTRTECNKFDKLEFLLVIHEIR